MGKKEFATFTISQVGLLFRDNKCLILEFNPSKKWGFPGGRIDQGEEIDQETAFRRELKEEMGWNNVVIGPIVDYDTWFFEAGKCGVIFYIETDEAITLSFEHSSYRFISEDEIDSYTYIWPNVARMIKKGFAYHRSRHSL